MARTVPAARRRALVIASAGYFFVLLDVTVVNVALARIGADLGASRSELQWVVDGYALALAAFMLGAGDLADRLGSQRVFIVGLALFGAGSTACATAPDAGVLIASRVLQGLGAAAILPTSLALVNEIFPDPGERPQAIGIWAGVGGSALVIGPILGGLLVDSLGWRAIFWLNLPLTAIPLAFALLHLPARTASPDRGLDLRGQLLGTLSLTAAVLALIEGGREGLAYAPALAAAALAALAFAGFVAAELRRRDPMLDPRWFGRPEFSGANAGAGLMNLGTLGALFAISLFLQQDEGLSPLRTGLTLIPLATPLALIAPFGGRLVAAAGPQRPAGLGLLTCGAAYLGLAATRTGLAGPWGLALLAVAGVGMALATPALVAGATEALGERRAGIASAVNNTSRQVGGAIGVALIGAFSSVGTALAASGGALALGGFAALALMSPRLDA